MDSNVETMIKLIEEDVDSFARRAEMYYKIRPKLMKMVEFYRAYRALAERYDHAIGALRQAQKIMAEAFPNKIPFVLTDESPSSSSGNEMEPHTPEMHAPVRALFDSDDIQKDPLVVSPYFHAIKRRGAYAEENDALISRKGLKQLNEMISAGEGSASLFLAEGGAKKVLSFQDKGKNSKYKTPYCPKDLPNQESSEEEDGHDKVKFSQELSQLSQENTKLKSQITSESERADKAEGEVQTLKFSLSKLKIEMEDSISKYQQSLERIFYLETQISHTQDDLKKLNDDVVNGSMKLCSAQEQCVLLEKTNQSLQLEQGMTEQKAKTQQEELRKMQEESEKLKNTIQDERQRVMESDMALQMMEKQHSQSHEELKLLALEVERGIDKLKAMELRNTSLEEEIRHLKEENDSLNEQNLSSALKIKNLQDNIIILKETRGELEHKMGLNLEQTKGIQHEFDRIKEEKDDLERRYQGLMEEMEAVSLNAESLQQLLKELQGAHAELEEICKKQEDEKLLLLTNLKNMEKISEKNKVLELSLSDANIELEELRGRIKTLEGSCESAYGQIATHISEKAALVSQLETTVQNMEKMTEGNAFLENSVSNMNSEHQDLRGKLKNLEDSYQSLYDQKTNLLAENNSLNEQNLSSALKIKNLKDNIIILKETRGELEHKMGLNLERTKGIQHEFDRIKEEKDDLERRYQGLMEEMEAVSLNAESLQQLLKELQGAHAELEEICKKQEDEKLLLLTNLKNMEKNSEKNKVLELSLSDSNIELEELRGRIKTLEGSCESAYGQIATHISEKAALVSQLETIVQNMEKMTEGNAFLENSVSNMNSEHQDLRGKLKNLEDSYQSLYDQKTNLLAENNTLVSQVDSISQSLEGMESRYAELEDKHLNLEREKDLTLQQINELECFLILEKQEREVLTHSNKRQLATLENQIHFLQ